MDSLLQTKKLHLFDLDDTLIETRPVYQKAQEAAIQVVFQGQTPAQLTARSKKIKFLSKAFGSGLVEQYFGAFLKEEKLTPEQKTKHKEDLIRLYYQDYWKGLKAMVGAIEWLDLLLEKGHTIGLISNGKVELQQKKLSLTGLEKYFPVDVQWISGAFAPEHKKPSPHMFERALDHFSLQPEEAVYYGNITADMLGANLSGMTSYLLGSMEVGLIDLAKADQSFDSWLGLKGARC